MSERRADASSAAVANLARVFSERDPARRRQAILELYDGDAVLYEPNAIHVGVESIIGAVTRLLESLPPDLAFVPVGAAMANHDLEKLLWKGQLRDGTVIVTGTDVVQTQGGRIRKIWVFLDTPT